MVFTNSYIQRLVNIHGENMSMMIAEIYEALVEAGTSEEKAKAAAGVVPVIDSLATKTDMQELRSVLKADLLEHRSEMQAELKVLKFAVFTLYPFVLAIAYRIFS